jgi:hypothetical protein
VILRSEIGIKWKSVIRAIRDIDGTKASGSGLEKGCLKQLLQRRNKTTALQRKISFYPWLGMYPPRASIFSYGAQIMRPQASRAKDRPHRFNAIDVHAQGMRSPHQLVNSLLVV